ncbi:hypothetical protein [Methyloligella solikamskensis]|uniref:Uncharacterized protein n=1 Tax=Methyloligella solikamskensis TaxID=1177756 RepID=A0ABW3JAP9_9HYPH
MFGLSTYQFLGVSLVRARWLAELRKTADEYERLRRKLGWADQERRQALIRAGDLTENDEARRLLAASLQASSRLEHRNAELNQTLRRIAKDVATSIAKAGGSEFATPELIEKVQASLLDGSSVTDLLKSCRSTAPAPELRNDG